MSDITFTLDDREVTKKINSLADGVKSFKKPFETVGDELLGFYGEDVFASQGQLSGGKWRNLSVETLKARKYGYGHYAKTPIATNMILVWTGTLKKGFKKAVTSTRLTIRNTVKYFKYNQPARKMLTINQYVIEKVTATFNEYLAKLMK